MERKVDYLYNQAQNQAKKRAQDEYEKDINEGVSNAVNSIQSGIKFAKAIIDGKDAATIVSSCLDTIGSFAAFIPGYGTAISAALGMVSGIVSMFEKSEPSEIQLLQQHLDKQFDKVHNKLDKISHQISSFRDEVILKMKLLTAQDQINVVIATHKLIFNNFKIPNKKDRQQKSKVQKHCKHLEQILKDLNIVKCVALFEPSNLEIMFNEITMNQSENLFEDENDKNKKQTNNKMTCEIKVEFYKKYILARTLYQSILLIQQLILPEDQQETKQIIKEFGNLDKDLKKYKKIYYATFKYQQFYQCKQSLMNKHVEKFQFQAEVCRQVFSPVDQYKMCWIRTEPNSTLVKMNPKYKHFEQFEKEIKAASYGSIKNPIYQYLKYHKFTKEQIRKTFQNPTDLSNMYSRSAFLYLYQYHNEIKKTIDKYQQEEKTHQVDLNAWWKLWHKDIYIQAIEIRNTLERHNMTYQEYLAKVQGKLKKLKMTKKDTRESIFQRAAYQVFQDIYLKFQQDNYAVKLIRFHLSEDYCSYTFFRLQSNDDNLIKNVLHKNRIPFDKSRQYERARLFKEVSNQDKKPARKWGKWTAEDGNITYRDYNDGDIVFGQGYSEPIIQFPYFIYEDNKILDKAVKEQLFGKGFTEIWKKPQ